MRNDPLGLLEDKPVRMSAEQAAEQEWQSKNTLQKFLAHGHVALLVFGVYFAVQLLTGFNVTRAGRIIAIAIYLISLVTSLLS